MFIYALDNTIVAVIVPVQTFGDNLNGLGPFTDPV